MAVVAQLLRKEDLVTLNEDTLDILELIVYKEIVGNDEFMKNLGQTINESAARIQSQGQGGYSAGGGGKSSS